MKLKAPFPYFGGKSAISHHVWNALGDVKHYIEPFFGSGAVLLLRPDYRQGEHVETVCDADGYVCNVWRALQLSPDEVANVCDWPVNHCDLSARKRKLIENKTNLVERLIEDNKYCDIELAGYWIWAASCWIAHGLTCVGQRPHLANGGMGVHKLGQIPPVTDDCPDVREPYNTNIYAWFRRLAERLRYVRVVCGDWTRVCGGDWQDKFGNVGIFFDPPYGVDDRNTRIYGDTDSTDVAHDVRKWCIERGNKPTYRIVLAGYDEHDKLKQHGWRSMNWSTQGGYANLGKGKSRGTNNRHREMLWFSPHCIAGETMLFDTGGEAENNV